ncbi:MAG TPA: hypothetical protein VMF32_08820 [Xanthobacteraceae bacterium]|nr:hypothetical protein [Xanthobacteraceae bacterium]
MRKFSDMRNKYNVRDIHLIFAGFEELWIRLNGLENKVFPNLCTDLDAIAEIIGRSGDPTLGDKFDIRPADKTT